MLQTLSQLNWAQASFIVGIIPATSGLTWLACRYTDLLKHPQTGYPPRHTHVCDLERSTFHECADHTVMAECSVSGCDVSMVVGRNIAGNYLVETERR